MTAVLNCTTTSSSNPFTRLAPLSLSNVKLPTTFIIQPPSSTQIRESALLNKRNKAVELGDLLSKKIKSHPAASENGSVEDSVYDTSNYSKGFEGLESNSIIDDIDSPSVKSSFDSTEKIDNLRSGDNLLIAQRSVSTPLVNNAFSLKQLSLNVEDGHKQVQHALEVLKKKMIIKQQASLLQEILLKAYCAQETPVIPPLITPSDTTASTFKKAKIILRNGDEEQEVIYGDVEYPFLSHSMPFDENSSLNNSLALNNMMSVGSSKDSGNSSPTYDSVKQSEESMIELRQALAVTRAETQKSESELSEKEGKRKRSKRTTNTEKTSKTQKKEKTQEKNKTKGRKAESKSQKIQMENLQQSAEQLKVFF